MPDPFHTHLTTVQAKSDTGNSPAPLGCPPPVLLPCSGDGKTAQKILTKTNHANVVPFDILAGLACLVSQLCSCQVDAWAASGFILTASPKQQQKASYPVPSLGRNMIKKISFSCHLISQLDVWHLIHAKNENIPSIIRAQRALH